MRWSVVVPVKTLGAAKSRLLPADDPSRPELAIAFLEDALDALNHSEHVERVIVVTDDERVRRLVEGCGAQWMPEAPHFGLNEAAAHGVSQAPPNSPVAVMAGDLPCLTTPAIDLVLSWAADYPRAFLSDAQGIGTTMLFARESADCTPAFGGRSRARHAQLGFTELGLDRPASERELLARARRDVDTPVDLWDAIRLGVGPATSRVLDWKQSP
jgi:2-phospho-L-lactate guanylyltransferase